MRVCARVFSLDEQLLKGLGGDGLVNYALDPADKGGVDFMSADGLIEAPLLPLRDVGPPAC